MSKPLINVNVPKAGRITTTHVVRWVVIGGAVIAVWNYSSRLPMVGTYAAKAKLLLKRIVGAA